MKLVINIKSFLQRLTYELWKILHFDLCGFLLVLKLDKKLYEYKNANLKKNLNKRLL